MSDQLELQNKQDIAVIKNELHHLRTTMETIEKRSLERSLEHKASDEQTRAMVQEVLNEIKSITKRVSENERGVSDLNVRVDESDDRYRFVKGLITILIPLLLVLIFVYFEFRAEKIIDQQLSELVEVV